jgi:SAP domain-containing new25/Domain of unknown function (DUF6434)
MRRFRIWSGCAADLSSGWISHEMTETRPNRAHPLTLSEFAGWYWLKEELVVICRMYSLSTVGSKLELEDRIRRYLSGVAPVPALTRRSTGKMPAAFTEKSVIGKGWRCNPALGAYLREVCGKGFRFNAAMRDFIHNGEGRTLAEAVICCRASIQPSAPKPPIARQLEYNQHFRDFFASQSGATRRQAIDAWWEKRSRRNGTRRRAD